MSIQLRLRSTVLAPFVLVGRAGDFPAKTVCAPPVAQGPRAKIGGSDDRKRWRNHEDVLVAATPEEASAPQPRRKTTRAAGAQALLAVRRAQTRSPVRAQASRGRPPGAAAAQSDPPPPSLKPPPPSSCRITARRPRSQIGPHKREQNGTVCLGGRLSCCWRA